MSGFGLRFISYRERDLGVEEERTKDLPHQRRQVQGGAVSFKNKLQLRRQGTKEG